MPQTERSNKKWQLFYGLLFSVVLFFSFEVWAINLNTPDDPTNPDIAAVTQRLDSEVLGWSKDYSELACVALDLTITAQEARGEASIVVYNPQNSRPVYNFHLAFINTLEIKDRSPLAILKSQMVFIDSKYKRRWPKRPNKKAGVMTIKPVHELVELGEGLCQVAVGFVFTRKSEQRYQTHQLLPLQTDCTHLRYTDFNLVWAKSDLAAVLMRFDYGPKDNERSIRFPVWAAWNLGSPVTIVLRSPADTKEQLANVKKILNIYGKAKIVAGDPGDVWVVKASPKHLYLGTRLAAELNGRLLSEPAPTGTDILIERGLVEAATEPSSKVKNGSAEDFDPAYRNCGGLLPDCDR